MKEIKFRAFLKADGRIYEVLSIDFLNKEATLWDKETAVNFEASFDEIELMQYTGINDINGEEIYTDFLVEYFRGGIKKLGKIKLEDGRFIITPLWEEFDEGSDNWILRAEIISDEKQKLTMTEYSVKTPLTYVI